MTPLCDQILLVRHGRPRIEWPRRCRHGDFKRWMAEYEAAELDPGSPPPPKLVEVAAESGLFLSSFRPRSYQSAQRLSQGLPVVQLSELDEVPLPHLPIPVIELPTELWVLLTRLSHVAGYAHETESINMARARSRLAARRIAEYASDNRKVAVVAHGTINWLIGRNLKRQGWRVQSRGELGSYWHWRLFRLIDRSAA
jgi:broad specificity phosphatase PhoE